MMINTQTTQLIKGIIIYNVSACLFSIRDSMSDMKSLVHLASRFNNAKLPALHKAGFLPLYLEVKGDEGVR